MRNVTIQSPYGGAPSIYWLAVETASDAEAIARRQAGSGTTAQTRPVWSTPTTSTPADELRPRLHLVDGIRVFTFDDSRTAYDGPRSATS